jgi:hypothetical protein
MNLEAGDGAAHVTCHPVPLLDLSSKLIAVVSAEQ